MERPMKLRIHYTQSVRSAGLSTFAPETFAADIPVMIRSVGIDEAPVACRVTGGIAQHDAAGEHDYFVRNFEGRLWWPAVWEGRLVDQADFERSAAGGSTYAALAIDPTSEFSSPDYPPISEQARALKETRDSTEGMRISSAQRGALGVIDCDGWI